MPSGEHIWAPLTYGGSRFAPCSWRSRTSWEHVRRAGSMCVCVQVCLCACACARVYMRARVCVAGTDCTQTAVIPSFSSLSAGTSGSQAVAAALTSQPASASIPIIDTMAFSSPPSTTLSPHTGVGGTARCEHAQWCVVMVVAMDSALTYVR